MRPVLIIAAALALVPLRAYAAEAVVGLATPLSGPSAILGAQMRHGAEAAAQALGARLTIADDACTAAGGAEAARSFVAAKADVATGFLCSEAIEAALPILKEAGIAVVAVGVRTNSLTERRARTGWPVVRLSPRSDDEIEAAASILGRAWRDQLFAIVDDGTIYSRELAEGFRLSIEQQNLKAVFVDTLRPQLDNQIGLAGRLRKSGATHVFVAGDRPDVAILGRDAGQIGYAVTIAGGEVLRAAPEGVDLRAGTLMIGLPEWSEIADPAVVSRLRDAGIEPEGYVLPAYAGVEISVQAAAAARANGTGILAALADQDFATVLGSVGFDAKGDRTDNPYRLFRWDGASFIEMDQP
jgi:branched-chain amino acid transport system substrate-binding protein